jgi:hypothetical protein
MGIMTVTNIERTEIDFITGIVCLPVAAVWAVEGFQADVSRSPPHSGKIIHSLASRPPPRTAARSIFSKT